MTHTALLKRKRSKIITAVRGEEFIVDAEDYECLSKLRWYSCDGYARNYKHKNNKTTQKLMHRMILRVRKGMEVDHINGNRADNRKSNLRICKVGINSRNSCLRKDNTSGYKGVCRHKGHNNWIAGYGGKGGRIHIGSFKTAEAAAKAYDKAVLKAYGEYAKTNKMLGLYKKNRALLERIGHE